MVSSSTDQSSNPILSFLVFGFWVHGFRCFPWLAVNFFLKDRLHVEPSTLQLLQNSANLPMVGKPLYGLVSDAVYISGQHRIPYIAIGAFLQAISWLAIAIHSQSSISIFTMSICLLFSNLGASIAEVANDAIIAEAGKQPTTSSKNAQSCSGELQSFVWMASAAGGILGNRLGGFAIDSLSPKSMFLFFGCLVALQFFITITVWESSLKLPKSSSNGGIRKQLSELSAALRIPEIAYSLAWFAASYAIIPTLTRTMFFYQIQYLKIPSSVLGISKVFGQVALLLWGVIYNCYLKSVSSGILISAIQATLAVIMFSDVLFVKGTPELGVSDTLYVTFFSGLAEVMLLFKMLPFSVYIARLCPPGCEGSVMAFVMSAIVALALIVSGYLGVALVSYIGVTAEDYSGFTLAFLIQAICTLSPLYWLYLIPDDVKSKTSRKKE